MNTKKRQPSLLEVFLFCLWCPIVGSSESSPPPQCPAFPEQGAPNTVSLYIAKTQETAGFVCAKVINGLSGDLAVGGASLRLQRWEKEKWWRAGGFRDFVDTMPKGVIVGMTLVLMNLPPSATRTERFPRSGQPAPPGRYRVCFSSESVPPEGLQATICSAEFTLP